MACAFFTGQHGEEASWSDPTDPWQGSCLGLLRSLKPKPAPCTPGQRPPDADWSLTEKPLIPQTSQTAPPHLHSQSSPRPEGSDAAHSRIPAQPGLTAHTFSPSSQGILTTPLTPTQDRDALSTKDTVLVPMLGILLHSL